MEKWKHQREALPASCPFQGLFVSVPIRGTTFCISPSAALSRLSHWASGAFHNLSRSVTLSYKLQSDLKDCSRNIWIWLQQYTNSSSSDFPVQVQNHTFSHNCKEYFLGLLDMFFGYNHDNFLNFNISENNPSHPIHVFVFWKKRSKRISNVPEDDKC